MVKRGKFITFEGIDGAGKTTHLGWFGERLQAKLNASGARVIVSREPGGAPLSEALRKLLLHQTMQVKTEALLMFAARCEHLATVIEPALARGDWVLSDRFTDSTFAYQGGGRGLAIDKLETLERWVQGDFQPNLTILFDLPVEAARARRMAAHTADKFENQWDAFHTRVRAEYLRRARQAPDRFAVIDAARSVADIRCALEKIMINLK